ncbi:MAG: SDR family oxidoreductase [Ignavibacteriales bacterium]|nr:SDR family oxidoreductase [Ignavibacteriales bacterium]
MQSLLITGALGHIGSKFIHSLVSGEFETVRMIDNLSTLRYSSLFNLPGGVKFSFIEDDICTADLDLHLQNIDVVIHLAAITDAAASFQKKDEVEKVNYEGTKRISEACIKNNVKLFFPSTTSVYGTQKELVGEDCGIEDLKPQSPYAEYKLKSEQLLASLEKTDRLKFVACRFGTISGSSIGMRFHTAINKFCWQAVHGQPLTVWRTALNQKRPYLVLSDAINAIKFIVRKNLFDGKVYNVLTENLTVKSIIDFIELRIPQIDIKYVDSEIMNQLSYEVSNSRFIEQGFEYHGSIKESIAETINLLIASRSGKTFQHQKQKIGDAVL